MDILGCVYEYFLGWCASAGAKGRGEFYTHQSVDKLLVEMLEPMNRRVYDGCCGSGGIVVQAERFVEVHGGQRRAAAHIGLRAVTPVPAAPRLTPGRAWSTAANRDHRHLPAQSPARRGPPTVARSRFHEVINDQMESLTELQTDFADQPMSLSRAERR
jgi:hypothetical protein